MTAAAAALITVGKVTNNKDWRIFYDCQFRPDAIK